MKIVIDDKIPYIRGEAEKLGETAYFRGADITNDKLFDADALIIRTRTKVDENLLKNTNVKFVGTATIGYDHIDTDYLERNHIAWTNCPGCNAASVAQYVENALLAMAKNPDETVVFGIVGYGNVGHAVEKNLKPYGVKILKVDPFLGYDDDLSEADIVSFHTPLTHDGPHPTYHLCDADYLSKMKHGVMIINAARGGVVDENALLHALKSGHVSDCVIDTWENEPHVNRELLEAACIATPHIAGYSADGKANATRMVLEKMAKNLDETVDFCKILPPDLPADFAYYHPDETNEKLRLYDPRKDSEMLKKNAEDFEKLRGNYGLRREKSGA